MLLLSFDSAEDIVAGETRQDGTKCSGQFPTTNRKATAIREHCMPRAAVAYAVPVLGAGVGVRRCLVVRVKPREPGPDARVHELSRV